MMIDTSTWSTFKIREVFDDFITGKGNNTLLEEGNDCLYIGAKWANNGIMRRCKRNTELVQPGNCVIFICNGEGSVGLAMYMDSEFISTVDNVAGYSGNLNPLRGLFIATVASLERPKYSFGRKWKTYLKDTEIKLPSKPDGSPDWEYMDEFMKQLKYPNLTNWLKTI